MDAVINLSHFIGHRGKEKAKFTEMTNIFDSSSPVSHPLKNGQGHGLHYQINNISGRQGWRNCLAIHPFMVCILQ